MRELLARLPIAATALLYAHITGDSLPMWLGLVLTALIGDTLWLTAVLLSASIVALIAWHFWRDIVFQADAAAPPGQLLVPMSVAVLYMLVVLATAIRSFR